MGQSVLAIFVGFFLRHRTHAMRERVEDVGEDALVVFGRVRSRAGRPLHRLTLAVRASPEFAGGSHELEYAHVAVSAVFFDGAAYFGDRAFDVI